MTVFSHFPTAPLWKQIGDQPVLTSKCQTIIGKAKGTGCHTPLDMDRSGLEATFSCCGFQEEAIILGHYEFDGFSQCSRTKRIKEW